MEPQHVEAERTGDFENSPPSFLIERRCPVREDTAPVYRAKGQFAVIGTRSPVLNHNETDCAAIARARATLTHGDWDEIRPGALSLG
jgi:hypothetical protein